MLRRLFRRKQVSTHPRNLEIFLLQAGGLGQNFEKPVLLVCDMEEREYRHLRTLVLDVKTEQVAVCCYWGSLACNIVSEDSHPLVFNAANPLAGVQKWEACLHIRRHSASELVDPLQARDFVPAYHAFSISQGAVFTPAIYSTKYTHLEKVARLRP